MPQWMVHAHARAQRVGVRRMVIETGAVCGVAVAMVVLASATVFGSSLGVSAAALAFALTALVVGAVLHQTMPLVQELSVARFRMRKQATHDTRTGIVNRQHFIQQAYREWERCRRYRSGATLLVVDADHLDAVVEEHGRAAGDAVMRAIALSCDGMLRKPDLLGRYNGESLVVFLPHTDTLGAVDVAERIRNAIATNRVSWPKHPLRITVSVGVATLGDQHLSLNALMLDAEAALHTAQQAGRNCVRTSPTPPSRSGRSYPVMPH